MDPTEKQNNNCNRHPWELSRKSSILRQLEPVELGRTALDVGAGDMFFAKSYHQISGQIVYAIEPSNKIDRIQPYYLNVFPSLDELPTNLKFDLVFLLDVLEHIEDENPLLRELKTKLNSNARVVFTVPAYQFLFSEHDVFLGHHRRYEKAVLEKVLTEHEFIIDSTFYFYCSLFLVRWLTKIFNSLRLAAPPDKPQGIGNWQYPEHHLFTRSFTFLLNLDFSICQWLAQKNIHLPGLSLVAICRNKTPSAL